MTLKSALQDVKETTLAAVSGLLGKLAYLASLRRAQGRYEHWGMESVHGPESSERALKTAHAEIVAGSLAGAAGVSGRGSGAIEPRTAELRRGPTSRGCASAFDDLLPGERKDSPAASHLNSVLLALSSLEKNRGRATRSTS